jgi:SAM-dependent methyltransferase
MLRQWAQQIRLRLWVLPRLNRHYRSLSISETFRRIYSSNKWGIGEGGFCSGPGSFGPAAASYCDAVTAFIRENHIQSVVDLGCGDYAVGRTIAQSTGVRYIGVDVVPELIEYHRRHVRDRNTDFQCADITSSALPAADLCLVRQVLQHLSNDEIARVVANILHYPMVLVTEDVPVAPRSFNRDKPHGPDIRGYYGSGVYLDRPPFSLPVNELWTFELRDRAVLRTVLFGSNVSMRSS